MNQVITKRRSLIMPEKLEKEDLQCLIEKLTKESKKTPESIDSDIAFCKNIIDELEQEKIRIEKYDGKDELKIRRLTVMSNYPSWNYWKSEKRYSSPLYLEAEDSEGSTAISIALNLREMTQLRDYLDDKLEFAGYE